LTPAPVRILITVVTVQYILGVTDCWSSVCIVYFCDS
jgi:hypothetical protein